MSLRIAPNLFRYLVKQTKTLTSPVMVNKWPLFKRCKLQINWMKTSSLEKIRVEKTSWLLKTNPIQITRKNDLRCMRRLVKKSQTIPCTFIHKKKSTLEPSKATAKGWTCILTISILILLSKVLPETLRFLSVVLESIKPSSSNSSKFLGGSSLLGIEAQTPTTIPLQWISITMDKHRSSLWCPVRIVAIILLVGNMGRLLLRGTLTKWIVFTQCLSNNTKATNIQTTRDNNSACNTRTSQTWPTLDQSMTRLRNPATSQARWQGGIWSVIRVKTRLKSCTSLQLKGTLKLIIWSIRMRFRNTQLPR